MRLKWIPLCLFGAALAACDENSGAAPLSCVGADCVVVTTGRYNPDFTGVGTINTLDVGANNKITTAIDATLDPDVDLALRGEELVVLNRSTGTVRLYDTRTWMVKAEASAGDATHPAAASFPTSVYWIPSSLEVVVGFSGNDQDHALGVIDLATPEAGVKTWIALPVDAADTDGKAEPSSFYPCNGKLYVLLQSYAFDSSTFAVTYYPAKIAQLDGTRPTAVERTIALVGKNPNGITPAEGSCANVLVSSAGNLTTAPDGTSGIESVDLGKDASGGYLLTDQQLMGRASSVVAMSSSLAFVAHWTDLQPNDDGVIFLASAKVVAINPSTKAVIGDVLPKAGNIAFLKVSPSNKLFVGTGLYNGMEETGKLKKGLYIGPATGEGVPTTPLDFIDTPNGIAFER